MTAREKLINSIANLTEDINELELYIIIIAARIAQLKEEFIEERLLPAYPEYDDETRIKIETGKVIESTIPHPDGEIENAADEFLQNNLAKSARAKKINFFIPKRSGGITNE